MVDWLTISEWKLQSVYNLVLALANITFPLPLEGERSGEGVQTGR
jgi:hypothetical protein